MVSGLSVQARASSGKYVTLSVLLPGEFEDVGLPIVSLI